MPTIKGPGPGTQPKPVAAVLDGEEHIPVLEHEGLFNTMGLGKKNVVVLEEFILAKGGRGRGGHEKKWSRGNSRIGASSIGRNIYCFLIGCGE